MLTEPGPFCLKRFFRHRFTRHQAFVCCYHGTVECKRDNLLDRNLHVASDFREQTQFLKHKGVVSLAELTRQLEICGGAESRGVAITFDDGYANNLVTAEILAKFMLPWAIFISTGALGRNSSIWTVQLSLLLLHGDGPKIDALGQAWSLARREQREVAFQVIRQKLKSMAAMPRRQLMDDIRAQFPAGETERLLERFPSLSMLTWAELSQLADAGVEIGSHGVDHEIHHAAQDPEVRRRELVVSKKEIERQLGRPCRFFAFPNGDYCEHSAREVEAAGYEVAFTTQSGLIRPDSNRFLLPRVSPGGSVAKLKQQLKASH